MSEALQSPTRQSDDLATLIPFWERSLRATRRSPKTIKNYGDVSYLGP